MVEKLTQDLIQRAQSHIDEIEELGGMAKAIEVGIPKTRIEESAARMQARIDTGQQVIVGVNKYVPKEQEDIDVLVVDNEKKKCVQLNRATSFFERKQR